MIGGFSGLKEHKAIRTTLKQMTVWLTHEEKEISDVAASYYSTMSDPPTFFYHWHDDGSIEVLSKTPISDFDAPDSFIEALKKVSETEAEHRSSQHQAATRTLINIALRPERNKELIGYLLHRINNPIHPKDPIYIPNNMPILHHFTNRKAELRQAYRGAIEAAKKEDWTTFLISKLAFNFEDDFYLEMVARAQVLGKLEEQYEYGELLLRRKRTRSRPGTKRYHVSDY